MARLTAIGALSGAAACPPKRRRAVFPRTVGPEDGNGAAIVDETIKIVVLKRILEITRRAELLCGVCYAKKSPDGKQKVILPAIFFSGKNDRYGALDLWQGRIS